MIRGLKFCSPGLFETDSDAVLANSLLLPTIKFSNVYFKFKLLNLFGFTWAAES